MVTNLQPIIRMKNHKSAAVSAQDRLTELQNLVGEAQSLMGSSVVEPSKEVLENLRERLEDAQERFTEAYGVSRKSVSGAAKYTDKATRSNPYQSIAIAA